MKYTSKVVEVEALEITPATTLERLENWSQTFWPVDYTRFSKVGNNFYVFNRGNNLEIEPGDYVVGLAHDDFYPVKPDVFRRKYEV